MIKVFTYNPDLFDNNGDQGNLEILTRALREAGQDHETSTIELADFALVGDCSVAVLEHHMEDLLSLIPTLKDRLMNGLPTLLVGRSYELLGPALGIELELGERQSKFVVESSNGTEAFGYHNSEVLTPRLFVSGNFVGTTLFGPLFAKNPQLLEAMFNAWGIAPESDFWNVTKAYAQKVREATTFE